MNMNNNPEQLADEDEDEDEREECTSEVEKLNFGP